LTCLNISAVKEYYRCWAEVDLNALTANLAQIRSLAGSTKKILTVVKADAYGHGLRQIATRLMQSGTDLFGVANLTEARAIRSIGQGWPILLLGACLPEEVETAVRENLTATISSLEEAEQFSNAAKRVKKSALLQLKIDTGLGRLGVPPEKAAALLADIERLPGVLVNGLFTHYSSSEDDPAFTQKQRTLFSNVVQAMLSSGKRLDWIHASNSGGLLHETDSICNSVRPGLLVYGIVPPGQRSIDPHWATRFSPVLSWKCRVSFVKEVSPGTPISYGHTFVSDKPLRVATITAGYGDGYLRAASNRASVLIAGELCQVLGRVTMDQMVVDVSRVPEVFRGAEVVLIGEQGGQKITASELAGWCDTVPWEILTNIAYRVPRIYRGSHAA
jgi:alanine racemase